MATRTQTERKLCTNFLQCQECLEKHFFVAPEVVGKAPYQNEKEEEKQKKNSVGGGSDKKNNSVSNNYSLNGVLKMCWRDFSRDRREEGRERNPFFQAKFVLKTAFPCTKHERCLFYFFFLSDFTVSAYKLVNKNANERKLERSFSACVYVRMYVKPTGRSCVPGTNWSNMCRNEKKK